MKVAFLKYISCFLIGISLFTLVPMVQAESTCDMHALIKKNQYKKVQTCLEQQDADPNELDSNGSSALNLLFKFGDVEASLMHQNIYDLAKALILKGADVDYMSPENLTPFQAVLAEGSSSRKTRKMVALMLEHGADPETITIGYYSHLLNLKSYITPLIWAIKSHENTVLDVLLKKGIDLERIPAPNFLSPIETSLSYQNDYAFKLLQIHGVRIPERKAETYLKLATHQLGKFNTAYLQTIVDYDWPIQWSSPKSAQTVAFQLYQHQEIPPELFKQAIKNWKIQLPDVFLISAIQVDEGKDNPLFTALLEMGLDANIQFGEKRNTLLQLLAFRELCNLGKVELLLKHGACIKEKDTDGDTVLDQIRLEMQRIDNFIEQHKQEPNKQQNRYSENGDVNDIMAMAFGKSPKFSPLKKAQADQKKLSKMAEMLSE